MSADQNGEEKGFGQDRRSGRSVWERLPTLLKVSLICIGVGFFGMIIGRRGHICFRMAFLLALEAGVVLLIVWFVKLFVLPIVRRRQVVEQWDVLIRDGQERAGQMIEHARKLIRDTRAPDITLEEEDVAPGVLRGVLGVTRPFLVISNDTNSNLQKYCMYLNARDYGNNLQVSWYVTYRPGFWGTLLGLSLFFPFLNLLILPFYLLIRLPKAREAGLLDLDLFDLQDLTAYVTNAHHCVLDAVDKVLLDLSRDPSKIERKSRGFLGIS